MRAQYPLPHGPTKTDIYIFVSMFAWAKVGGSVCNSLGVETRSLLRAPSGSCLAYAMTQCVCVCLSLVCIYMPAASAVCNFVTLTAAWFGTTSVFTRPLTSTYDRQFWLLLWGGGGVQAWLYFP